jgi:Zn-finger nucleic acid-binding protein
MDCPRCKLPLEVETYEDVEIDVCRTCWGIWLDTGEMEEILLSRRSPLGSDEKAAAVQAPPGARNPIVPIPCPKCSRRMERLYIDPALYLVIDRCKTHGVWLDTGEVKTLQALAETSRDHCRNIVDTIRRRATPG